MNQLFAIATDVATIVALFIMHNLVGRLDIRDEDFCPPLDILGLVCSLLDG